MHRKESLLRPIFIVNGLLALLAVTLSFTGCGLLTPNTNTNNQPTRVATPAPTQASVSTSPAPGVPPPSTGPAIATADGDLPGIRVEIQELKRMSGDTLSLKFAMINDSDKELSFGYEFGDPDHSIKDFGGIGGIHLIDAVGKKKYFIARDTENTCVCSRNVPKITPKSRANLWGKFPAPPADVQKITVVIPHFIPMDDVPISQ